MPTMNVGAPRPLCDLYYSPEGYFQKIAERFANSMLAKQLLSIPPFC
jgi:hypothetical protein